MKIFDDIKKELRSLQTSGINKMIREIIQENSEVLIKYNLEQLDEGLDMNLESLGEYSPYTIEVKKAKGQQYDHINLKDTGDFRDSFKIDVSRDSFEVDATDSKTDELKEDFGAAILGINDEDVQRFVDTVLYRELNKKINLKFGIR